MNNFSFIVIKRDCPEENYNAIKRIYPNAKLVISREDIKIPERWITCYVDIEKLQDNIK